MLTAAEAGASRVDIVSDLLSLPKRRSEERRCAAIAEEMIERLELTEMRDRRAGAVPVGIARILELGRALCAAPNLLLLDEPSSGLDSDETRRFGELLHAINRDMGIGILLVEHDMDLVMEVCEHIYVLDFGRMTAHGTAAEVVANPLVRAAYLGEEEHEAAAPSP
jgi:ABC-type branched-subunit amino acid transport system ATPase component